MTITTYTDREIVLQKRVAELEKENAAFEKCLETENSARQNVVEMRSILAIENDTLRKQLSEAQAQCKKLEQELDAFDKSENSFMRKAIELEAMVEASRKQERVGIVKQKRGANGTFVLWNKYPSAEMELFAAPVVAPDVPTEAGRLVIPFESSLPYERNTA